MAFLKTKRTTTPKQLHRARFIISLLVIILIIFGAAAYLFRDLWRGDLKLATSQTSYEATVTPTPTPVQTPTTVTTTWPVELTYYQADSYTAVVNKKHKLPADYVPSDLTTVAYESLRVYTARAYEQMASDALLEGYKLKIASAYRSYQQQANLYNYYSSIDGTALADTYSARPGHSEHQLGLAVDIADANAGCQIMTCFGNTNAGQWLAANAANYGFIVRYPEGKEDITGYQYEPWHFRYVGITIAKSIVASGLTMDEYFGKTAGGY